MKSDSKILIFIASMILFLSYLSNSGLVKISSKWIFNIENEWIPNEIIDDSDIKLIKHIILLSIENISNDSKQNTKSNPKTDNYNSISSLFLKIKCEFHLANSELKYRFYYLFNYRFLQQIRFFHPPIS
ncbi:MAG: hypothetical protein R2771_13145 [Saprospiraceae bacterium]